MILELLRTWFNTTPDWLLTVLVSALGIIIILAIVCPAKSWWDVFGKLSWVATGIAFAAVEVAARKADRQRVGLQ